MQALLAYHVKRRSYLQAEGRLHNYVTQRRTGQIEEFQEV
jgi:hypothetical protein